jgi:ATP-binding cassette subfamily F protein 3
LGANGAGKSTLVKALVDGSTLLSGERSINKHTRIGYFAQHQLELLRIDESPLWHVQRQAPEAKESELRNHLGRFGFQGDRVTEPVAPFSGGEKARLVLALLILQKPNLLLLDEPTNHLDLDMRHALSVALMEYSGALLVISHDRHLLRSVCDDLYVVHNGQLHELRRPLDEYPNWLKEQEAEAEGDQDNSSSKAAKPRVANKKHNRQADAKRRQLLKPHLDKVRQTEKQMEKLKIELNQLDEQLADEGLYSDPGKVQDIQNWTRRQTEIRTQISDLEWQWLEASEQLEKAQSELESND